MAPSLVWNSKLAQARYGSWSGRPVRMKSRPRRSHSYCEGVMMFQRGGSMRSFPPPALGQRSASFPGSLPFGSLHLLQQGVKILPAKQPVAVHWMAVRHDFARLFPVAKCVRGHAEVVSGFRDAQVIPQLGHLTASQSDVQAWSTLYQSQCKLQEARGRNFWSSSRLAIMLCAADL